MGFALLAMINVLPVSIWGLNPWGPVHTRRFKTCLSIALLGLISGCATMDQGQCITANWFDVGYEDLQRDAQAVAEYVDNHLMKTAASPGIDRTEMITAVLYRGKGAYLVGKFFSGSEQFPLVLALLNTPGGIVVDAVLLHENEASILFSFTRSYFHVDVKRPAELVGFLKSIMPQKRIAELYISIGYNKHGKSELHCDFLQHLASSNEKFEIAEGEKGMVMEVFTMPDYDWLETPMVSRESA